VLHELKRAVDVLQPVIPGSEMLQPISHCLAARFALRARNRSRLIANASRSGALTSHSACMMAFENSITRLTPREVRASTISYCSGDNSRCRLANAGERSYTYARAFRWA
jgi:hypothetical protein